MFGRYMVTFDEQVPGWPTVGQRADDEAGGYGAEAHGPFADRRRHDGLRLQHGQLVPGRVESDELALSPGAVLRSPRQIGVKNFHNYVPGVMALAINGAFTTASGGSVLFQADTDAYQVSDDVTLIRGNHQLAVGTQRRRTGSTTRSTASVASGCGPSMARSPARACLTFSPGDCCRWNMPGRASWTSTCGTWVPTPRTPGRLAAA